jgi:protein tyrosine phosphatase (PTP) superfamily phosphohydrolase (DUF442 family)
MIVGWYLAAIVIGPNTHAVISGRVYRSAQLDGETLSAYLQKHRIRTVINLRGHCPDFAWYRSEAATCAALGVSQEDITLSANRLPPPQELKRLVQVLDHSEYPVLLHCKQGADRTGLASALVLLLYTDATVGRARVELLPHRGHWPVARTAAMDEFFDRYEAWLAGRPHDKATFRDWVLHHYQAGPADAELSWVTPIPPRLPANTPVALTVRARNTSADAWHLHPFSSSGIHLQYALYAPDGTEVLRDQAGLLRRVVTPGATIDFTLALPRLAPGTYALRAEMADFTGAAVAVRAKYFYQAGDAPLQEVLVVE